MPTPTTARSLPQSRPDAKRQITACVVDRRASDYDSWQNEAAAGGVLLHICSTAEEALRFGRTQPVALWVVNTDLPGLSGPELCGMLKSRSSATPVYLVADEYSPATELAAWSARATLFGCKGAHSAWLTEFLQIKSQRSDSRRTDSQLNRPDFAPTAVSHGALAQG